MAASNPDTGPHPDYDPNAWHDDTVYGMRFCTPDLISPHEVADDWTRAFILDIDHIVAWVRTENGIRFRVAPADLIFLDASDLEMAIDWGIPVGRPACTNRRLILSHANPRLARGRCRRSTVGELR